jgi:DNA-binding transcriptional MerR regulator
MPLSQTPTYNLKVVLKETGIAADTLRAWERRYGLPRPDRSAGGHRLYSQRDIHTIKWLMARQAEGLSISRAVDQWRTLVKEGRDPFAESPGAIAASTLAASTTLDALREQWLSACLAYDEATAEQILNQGFALFPVETVTQEVIQRSLRQMGELWQEGKASVQQEHFLSALVTRRLDALIAALPSPIYPRTILLACPPDEWHALPLLLLCLLLRRHGLNVVYLGASVPNYELDETLSKVQPSLVVMAAQQLATAAELRGTAEWLAEGSVAFAYGGRIFNLIPDLRALIPGDFLDEDLGAAAERINQLTERPRPALTQGSRRARPPSGAQNYLPERAAIESKLEGRFPATGFRPGELARINHYFGNALQAALNLGNVQYLQPDLDWIQALITAQDRPAESLRRYLVVYADTARQLVGAGAEEWTAWLEAYAAGI